MKFRDIKSSLIYSGGIYTATNILNAAIPFLLMPVLTRYLTPVDYGRLAMFNVLLTFIAPFTGLNVDGAIAREYYDRSETDISRYIGNCLHIFFGSVLIVGIVVYLSADALSKITSVPINWLWAVIVISAAQFVYRVVLTVWQVQVKPIPYGIYQGSMTLTILMLSIFFIVVLELNWQGRIQAQIIGCLLFAVFGFFLLRCGGWIDFRINKTYIKTALQFGVPFIPHTIAGAIKTIVDRTMITNMVSVSATGLYSVGFQIGMVIMVLEDSFNKAYVPWLFERLKRGRYIEKLIIVRLTYVYFVVILCLALALSAIAPWFLSFFLGQQFYDSSQFILWIALGCAFNGMYKMVVNYIFYERKTHLLAWVTFSVALISIIANYFTIRNVGAIGAAYTYTGMNCVNFLCVWLLSSRVYSMPWLLKNKHS